MTRSLGLVLVCVLVLAAIAPVAAVSAAQEDTPTPTANETRHVDPDETNQNGDLLGLQSALARRMAQRLSGSSVQLSQGQYELANQLIGQEYQDQYGKYVDVAGETDAEDSAESFETAQDRQREFVSDVQEYNEKNEAYWEARENGNEQRARRLARDLERLSENVSTTGTQLRRSYGTIGNQSNVDMSAGSEAVNETVANVSEQQAEIRELEFEATTLSISSRNDRASFGNPLVLDGRLVTENGSAVANRQVVLRINGRRLTTQTDASGAFTARYRPVTLRTGPAEVTVRYVPNATSRYLGSRANTSVTVEQVDSTTAIETAADQAAFEDSITVSGRVEAAARGVPNVPVVVSVAGTTIARGNTTAEGTFTLTGALPAGVPAGERQLRVRVPLEDRAVGGSSAARQLTVTETATNLTLDTSTTAAGIELTGQLATREGEGVAGQQLEIRRNGSVVATARTGSDGTYSVTVSGEPEERYRVTVTYDEPATNLGNATASVVVTLPPGVESAEQSGGAQGIGETTAAFIANNPVLVGAGVLVVVLLALAGGWWWTRDEEADIDRTMAPVDQVSSDSGAVSDPSTPDPLAPAKESIDENSSVAVERTYTTIRQRLRAQGLGSDDATHWEFFRSCDAAGIEHLDALETLTALYERAAFAPSGVTQADAEQALERARQFV